MCWNTSTTHQCEWRIWAALGSIFHWLALGNYNPTLPSDFRQRLVIFTMYQHFRWSMKPTKLFGIHSLEEVNDLFYFRLGTLLNVSICWYLHTYIQEMMFHVSYNFIFTVELASLILGTNYNHWAVLAQCSKSKDDSSTRYLSTR